MIDRLKIQRSDGEQANSPAHSTGKIRRLRPLGAALKRTRY
jgi:hypothetical protein